MLEKILRRFGFVPLTAMTEAVGAAWDEADRERWRRQAVEDRFEAEYAASGDGLADRLDELALDFDRMMAAHG